MIQSVLFVLLSQKRTQLLHQYIISLYTKAHAVLNAKDWNFTSVFAYILGK